MSLQYPFSALHGQDEVKTALLLCAIDPLIGGLLLEGPRGSAKSTSARALADLLPEGELVTLPLGASEEQLIGSLDLQRALQTGEVQFQAGLLSRAHHGVLYVDEVNLLADHLVDILLDVAASGVNLVERDGISHQHPARFVLMGSMNPEEGELRPQLLDRFGLFVRLPMLLSPELRQQIVRDRLAYDSDPVAFVAGHREAQDTWRQRIVDAREQLADVVCREAIFAEVSQLCHAAQVQGVRADLTLLRAAKAHAALQARAEVQSEDIQAVAEWVLAHRRQSTPEPSPAPDMPAQSPHSPSPPPEGNPWGAMPAPQAPPAQAVKSLKPLNPKKPWGGPVNAA